MKDNEVDKKDKNNNNNNAKRLANGKDLRQVKRRKWEEKQQRSRHQNKCKAREEWFERHSSIAIHLTIHNVQKVVAGREPGRGKATHDAATHKKSHTQHDADTERSSLMERLLTPYLDMKEQQERAGSSLFIAEGTETVRVLLQNHKRIQIQSVLFKPSIFFDPPVSLMNDTMKALGIPDSTSKNDDDEKQKQTKQDKPDDPPFHVLVGDQPLLNDMLGYESVRGALACGIIPHSDMGTLERILQRNQDEEGRPCRFLATDGICDVANMGAIIRSAAAFGVDAVVIGPDCCDPWYRRSVRVSMGHIFTVPIVRVPDMAQWIRQAKSSGVACYAAVLDDDAPMVLEDIPVGGIPSSWCCVVGSEGSGMKRPVVKECTERIRIGMVDGVDSLSVPIATGILLHGLRRCSKRTMDEIK